MLFSAFVVSRTMSLFNPLSFTLAYLTLHTYGLSLTKFVLLLLAHHLEDYWISCYAQDEMAYHLHLILCTSDGTRVTLLFPLRCGYAQKSTIVREVLIETGFNTFTSFHAPSRDMYGWSMHCACVV